MIKKKGKTININLNTFDKLFNDSNLLFFITDLETNILFTNAFALKRLEYKKNELINKKLINLLPPEKMKETEYLLSQIIAGKIKNISIPYVSKNKNIIYFNSYFQKGLWKNFEALNIISIENRNNTTKDENFLKKLMSCLPDVICITDLNGIIQFISPNIKNIINIKDENIYIGHKIFDMIADNDRQRAIKNFKKRLNKKLELVEYDITNYEKTKVIPCEVAGETLVDETGKPYGVILILRDIIKRKEIEKIMKENTNYYKFLSTSSITLMKINSASKILNFLSLSLKELIKDCLIFIYTFNDKDKSIHLFDINCTNNDILIKIKNTIKSDYIPSDGIFFKNNFLYEFDTINECSNCIASKLNIYEIVNKIKINKVYSIGLIGHNRLIGGLEIITFNNSIIKNPNLIEAFIHQASIAYENCSFMEELSLSEEKFRELASNIDQVFWLRTNDKMLYISPAYEKLFGKTCQSLYDNPNSFFDSIIDQDKPRIANSLNSEKYTVNKMFDEEYRIQRPDGSVRYIRAKTFPITDEEGNIIKEAGIAEDITEIKNFEEIIIKAKLDADQANEAKSRFLANISHEIRTPLSIMIGFLELLDKTELTEIQRDYLIHTMNASEMLLFLINDILDFSKIEADKMTIEKSNFNLFDLINDTIKLFLPKIKEKNIAIDYYINNNIPKQIIGDPSRIKQILNNLISNAVKFTNTGSIKINVEILDEDENTIELKFEIIDTGIGINLENINKLFNPFTQIDSSTTRAYQGTGLGLAITKRLIEMMDGKIEVESKINEGSKFYFTIKFEKSKNDNSAKANKIVIYEDNVKLNQNYDKKNANENIAINNKNLKILLAEDVELNVKIINKFLELNGYSCDNVYNGKEAVEAYSKNEYDIILMDCQMPIMDGYEATRKIRAIEKNKKHTIIIAMTAYAMEGDKKKCFEAGMDDYLSKPVDFNKLLSILSNYQNKAQDKNNILDNIIDKMIKNNNLEADFIKNLIKEYIIMFDETLPLIKQNINNGNLEVAEKLAHKMKGASANLEIDYLYKKFIDLEKNIIEKNIKESLDEIEEIEKFRINLV